ncbi:MAG TPA: Type 1 glutamine amidotransferase-like domain-containing protein [Candidatus Saccharimonadia bacterium]
MKLVFASQGFTTPEIAKAVERLAGKPLATLNVAVINEAYVGIEAGRDESWLITELSQIAHYAKGTISFVNLRAYDLSEIKERLAFADVIYIVGGAQIVLPKLFRETGFGTLLAELAETKIIMGTSAGANVLGGQIEDAGYWEDQYGSSRDYLAEPALGLVNFNILPHFERADHPLRTTARLTPLLKDHPFPLYGVTDTQAVIFNDGQFEFVGGEPATFGQAS